MINEATKLNNEDGPNGDPAVNIKFILIIEF
jgi:hypothetical protein